MNIKFNLFKDNLSWSGVIHQLNSDILKRHVLVNGNVGCVDVRFSYCEATSTGRISNQHDDTLGEFSILA
ncbi:hypothetical protein A3712_06660 [Vibrio sp. HI00D65]|uniref:Uncharacterized protein n=1 Tax=Vibrio chagasii TaxID=170679 RepID=A0A2S7V7F2_9VIBR|nr:MULTISPECIES: hypothetical protein [Vibrio]KZX55557.1 hypothetical protein A3712_06660 [Vibrio sp. HI00D65]PQJ58133.1 hypothetical protein BTO10_20670 [Vibrio chagasii]|tara:strand:+ start:366 stop:575 length:210 start_codon:yes stop_codon:yes gene_type:complete